MHDMASKMAELKFEAPLAKFEEADDWIDYQTGGNLKAAAINDTLNLNNLKILKLQQKSEELFMKKESEFIKDSNDLNDNDDLFGDANDNNSMMDNNEVNKMKQNQKINADSSDNFNETFSGSLEDLVNTFDEKITKCFGNYEESVENLAPVQIRTQEEIMNDCQ